MNPHICKVILRQLPVSVFIVYLKYDYTDVKRESRDCRVRQSLTFDSLLIATGTVSMTSLVKESKCAYELAKIHLLNNLTGIRPNKV